MRPAFARATIGLLLLALTAPAAVRAQGTLSTQGFGYPGGQQSTRSLGTGGALGESDPFSATNPAAIYNFGGSVLYFQAEPEYRTVRVGAESEQATIARYPLVTAGVPIGASFLGALTVSNLLDRSFQSTGRSSQTIRGTPVSSTNRFTSDGAIGDVRLALAWAPTTWLHVGGAGHVITGDNKLRSSQIFDDSAKYASLVDTQTVTYTGTAYSAGVDLVAGNIATFSGSYRRGGPLSIKRADTTLRTGHVPDRLSFGAAFIGVRGSTLGIRTSRETWSKLAPLASQLLRVNESWDTSVGADVLGPRVFGSAMQLRAGARRRTLPFGVPVKSPFVDVTGGVDVKETSYSFGSGFGLARGRAALDLAAIHATRSAAGIDATESAWTLSVGVSVRP